MRNQSISTKFVHYTRFLSKVKFNIFRYNCNRYDEDEARLAREGQEKSRSALQRYLFYCNRYMNHLQSLKFENKLYSMVKVIIKTRYNIYLFNTDKIKYCQCRFDKI